jgi:hypothetical protein
MQLLNVKSVTERRENMLWFRVPPKVYFKVCACVCMYVCVRDTERKRGRVKERKVCVCVCAQRPIE